MKTRKPEFNMNWFEHQGETFVSLKEFKGFKKTSWVQIHREDDIERVQITMQQHIVQDWI